jgi:hypothetical protein
VPSRALMRSGHDDGLCRPGARGRDDEAEVFDYWVFDGDK